MQVVVHQFEGVSTMQALPLAGGLLCASARLDSTLADRTVLTLRTGRPDPADAVSRGDVLAYSIYVWNERYTLEVARRSRASAPGALVLLGGPSVPRRPDRAAQYLRDHPTVDALALGEGEGTFRDVLRALVDGRPLDGVPGLALRAERRAEGAVLTSPRARTTDFADVGSPYLDGTFDALLAAGLQPTAAILETNRGCPFKCTFCDWGQAIASPVHELPRDRLDAELDWVGERGIPYLYIVDANYGMRRRDVEIVREIGRVKARHDAPQYVFFHLTKNATERHLEVVTALREAGIGTHLALSAQDFEPAVLRALERENIRLDRALELRRLCHERGIGTLNELLLGLPEQTWDSFTRGLVQAVTPWPGDAFQLYLARLLENAKLASPEQRSRWGLQTRTVEMASFHRAGSGGPIIELEELVVGTDAMSVDDWRRAFGFGFLLAAAHNLRLLDVVLQVARRVEGIDLRELVRRLQELPLIRAVLDRYADAILDGEAMVLDDPDTGDHRWAVEDALALLALRGRDTFYLAVEAALREAWPTASALHEAVRFQAFLAPSLGDDMRQASFTHDFAAFRVGASALAARPNHLAFAPFPQFAAATDWKSLLVLWLSAAHARQAAGAVWEIGSPEGAEASPGA